MSQLLPNLGKPLVVQDEKGQVLGYYMLTMLISEKEVQLAEDQIEREIKEGKGRPWPTLLADLEKRS